MDWLFERYGYRQPEDLYVVRKRDFKQNYGAGLLFTQYADSVYQALEDYRPDFSWLPWRFHTAPKRYWSDAQNRRDYMEWLDNELGFTCIQDWYSVTKATFKTHDGAGMLHCAYGDSVQSALVEYLPDYPWKPWLFRETPVRYWHAQENRRSYMNWLGARLEYSRIQDWYKVSKRDFCQNYGGGLLRNHYGCSPIRAVLEFFPELNQQPWVFQTVQRGHWQTASNRFAYLRWLRATLNLETEADWAALTSKDLRQDHGSSLNAYYRRAPAGLAAGEIALVMAEIFQVDTQTYHDAFEAPVEHKLVVTIV